MGAALPSVAILLGAEATVTTATALLDKSVRAMGKLRGTLWPQGQTVQDGRHRV